MNGIALGVDGADVARALAVDAEKHQIMVQGGVPGARNGFVLVRQAVKAAKKSTKR